MLLLLLGCETTPEEPPPRATPPASTAATLEWTAPPAWPAEKTAKTGEYRAKYNIPTQGDAKHPAVLLVQRFPGSKVAAAERDYLLALFEKTDGPKTTNKTVGTFEIELVEISGTYKFPMGPPMGKKRKHSAHVIKDDWRALTATINTKKKGYWFFRMVGPNDTIEGARSAFHAMVEGAK
jgi:hypothetical protein